MVAGFRWESSRGPVQAIVFISALLSANPPDTYACAGLTPTVRSSDRKARVGHIRTKAPRSLRCALTEAAQHTPPAADPCVPNTNRSPNAVGRKIGKVAIARQLLTLCYYGLRDGEIRRLNHQPADDHHEQLARATWPAPAHATLALTRARGASPSWLALCLASSPHRKERPPVLIEPPGTPRHPGPPRATGWMTVVPSGNAVSEPAPATRPP